MTPATSTTDGVKTRLIVGMEVHVELACRSKMFTGAPNVAHPDYDDAPPNSLCDPVVLGLPGALPVINRQAVEMAMLVGLALGSQIQRFTKWDRKSYYYPDLPKNYQISQYDQPLCVGGKLELSEFPGSPVRLIRAHLEEDAGKLLHEAPGGGKIDGSIVDLNRAGTPLLEIVTEPDIVTPEQAVAFGQALRDICRWLGVTEGVMQKGHMRFEPNINVVIERDGKTHKTPIVEIKNLNSFKALHGAIAYEYHRQVEAFLETPGIAAGTPGGKSTRGWDDETGTTFLQRQKEEAHDYRYFPDPDLVPVKVDDAWLEKVRSRLVELPTAKEKRYVETLALNPKDARALIDEPRLGRFFETILASGIDPRKAAAILLNNLAKIANARKVSPAELGISPAQVAAVAKMAQENKISSSAADELYQLCCNPDNAQADPEKLALDHGLLQVSDDSSLEAWIDQALAANPKSVEAIKGGKEAAVGALVGAVMKLSKGKANPKLVGERIKSKLLS